MDQAPRRREILAGTGAMLALSALQGCNSVQSPADARSNATARLDVPRLQVSPDQVNRITVCTRPFRAQGPRLDVEQIGSKTIVHNYGHGGSGWSLSWGSSGIAVRKALSTGAAEVAVIGCGALGLTSALLLQRAGIGVTIYARELPPQVRSSLATGVWSPDSRICLEENATPAFQQMWEAMARDSFQTYQGYLGLAGNPVEFIDQYTIWDVPDWNARGAPSSDTRPPFAALEKARLRDLSPATREYAPGRHPFGDRYVQRDALMMYNLTAYARLLMADFVANHGAIEIMEFHSPDDFTKLRQPTLINATGYGARALFGDASVIPVRGQVARTRPTSEVRYAMQYRDAYFVPRRVGSVFQVIGDSDYYGFNDDTTRPDRAEAEHAVNAIAGLFA